MFSYFLVIHKKVEELLVILLEMKDKVLPSFKFNNRKENFTFLDAVYGDKNIYSTVRDMLRWDLAINDGNMFKKETLDAAFQGYSHEKKGIKNYGLGWRLYELPSGKKNHLSQWLVAWKQHCIQQISIRFYHNHCIGK